MMPALLEWDKSVFSFLNSGFHNSFLDWLMPVITDFSYFRIPLFLGLAAIFIGGGKKGRWLVVLGLIGVGLADFTSHQFLKPLFVRLRPCHELENIRLLIGCGGLYGFPSNHACNFFGTAVFFTYFYRRFGWVLFLPAILIGWSRIYVGVHYPLDVIGGAVWGTVLATAVLGLAKIIFKEKLRLSEAAKPTPLIVVFVLSFGASFFLTVESAGACNCVQRCKICPPDCLCVRSGSCQCFECWCT